MSIQKITEERNKLEDRCGKLEKMMEDSINKLAIFATRESLMLEVLNGNDSDEIKCDAIKSLILNEY